MATLSYKVDVMSDGSIEIDASVPPPPVTEGERWYLKSYLEIPKTVGGGGTNFCALTLLPIPVEGTGGQTNWVQLDDDEIELLRRINHMVIGDEIWHYLVGPDGKIYRTIGSNDPDLIGASIRWPRIAIGSKGDGERNEVLKIGISNDGFFTKIAGIPHSTSYNAYDPVKFPWFFHRIYCSYQNQVIGDTPKGVLTMPILDPNSGYKVSVGERDLWIKTEYLHSRVGTPPVPSPAIVHELVTIPEPHPMVIHIYRIDLTKVAPFVSPYLGYKLTPSQFALKYNLDFCINGDGGPWLNGALLSAGRWMSNGHWVASIIGENSIWFDRAGHCQFKYAKPSGFDPWNVISGPSHMIQNGSIFQPYNNTLLAARSAFGLFDTTHAFALAVEGEEYVSGMTEQELAEFGLRLGATQMMEFDSGGSTSASQKNGVSYSVENRPVLNVLGFKVTS